MENAIKAGRIALKEQIPTCAYLCTLSLGTGSPEDLGDLMKEITYS